MLSLLYALLCLPIAFEDKALTQEPVSPRLTAMLKKLEAGNTKAVDEFWKEMAREHTPLIEAIAGDAQHVLVSFLWRGGEDIKTVAVMYGGTPQLDKHQLKRHPGTDVWFRTEKMRADVRCCYLFSINDSLVSMSESGEQEWFRRMMRMKADPLNSQREFSLAKSQSILELPQAPAQPWIKRRENMPHGTVTSHKIKSACLGTDRTFGVYTPASYKKDGPPCGLLIVFDGLAYQMVVPTPVILDNLIAEKAIPNLITVFIYHPDRGKDLSCNPLFADFLATELVPWMRKEYGISADPRQVVVAGASLGGLASTYVAFKHPETFGNVLSQSGSYWYKPESEKEPIWLARQFAKSTMLPVQFYLDAGLMETSDVTAGDSILASNRHLRDVLHARGYSVHYREFNGGHEMLNWRGTLADGLLLLIGNKDWLKAHGMNQER